MEIIDIVLYSLIAALVLIIIIGLAVANYAGENMINVYRHYSNQIVDFTSPHGFVEAVSNAEFGGRVRCRVQQGFLNDHYYNWVVTLSSEVAKGANLSSLAVCAHELGHALQYRDTPQKMKKFTAKLLLCKTLAKLTFPVFIIGLCALILNTIVAIGIIGVALVMFFAGLAAKLSTIKIEKEASENAIFLLQRYAYYDDYQIKITKKVLKAAKLTYIASFLKSVLKWTMFVRKYDFY